VKRKVLIEDVLGLFYAGDPVLFLVNMKTINCCLMLIIIYLIWSLFPPPPPIQIEMTLNQHHCHGHPLAPPRPL
jgi:hypothetical protein